MLKDNFKIINISASVGNTTKDDNNITPLFYIKKAIKLYIIFQYDRILFRIVERYSVRIISILFRRKNVRNY